MGPGGEGPSRSPPVSPAMYYTYHQRLLNADSSLKWFRTLAAGVYAVYAELPRPVEPRALNECVAAVTPPPLNTEISFAAMTNISINRKQVVVVVGLPIIAHGSSGVLCAPHKRLLAVLTEIIQWLDRKRIIK